MSRPLVPQLKKLDPAKAGTFLLINQLVTPGAGSIMGGRRVGYAQMALAFAGFLLVCWFFYGLVAEAWKTGKFPTDLGPYGAMGLTGLFGFVASWFWSLWTSISMWREARRMKANSQSAETPPPLPSTEED